MFNVVYQEYIKSSLHTFEVIQYDTMMVEWGFKGGTMLKWKGGLQPEDQFLPPNHETEALNKQLHYLFCSIL